MIIHTAMTTEWTPEPSVLQQHTVSSLSINTVPTPSCSACVHSSLNKQSEEMEQQQSADKALHQYCDSTWAKDINHGISREKWGSTTRSEMLLLWQSGALCSKHAVCLRSSKWQPKLHHSPLLSNSHKSCEVTRDWNEWEKGEGAKGLQTGTHYWTQPWCDLSLRQWCHFLRSSITVLWSIYQTALSVQQKPQWDV